MTIKEYLLKSNKMSTIDMLNENINEIKTDLEKQEEFLTQLKISNSEMKHEFAELLNNMTALSNLYNEILKSVLIQIEKVDCGFLNRKIPPHIQKQL